MKRPHRTRRSVRPGLVRRSAVPALFVLCSLLGTDAEVRAENPNWPPPESVTDLSDPKYWPDDPGYGGAWELFSFIPEDAQSKVRPAELSIGSGIHADRAWQKTIGDDRVVIAVLDSGIRWTERELVNKYYLNKQELPAPDAACRGPAYDPARPHDADGDGVFNILDYTEQAGHQEPKTPCDPRILGFAAGWDTNQNGILDPQDLIQIFSDGKDDDQNGYIDDISGWDFFNNDNDPNDDTNFGHGTGEAKDSAAEAQNGRGDLGVCPLCRVLMVRIGDSFVPDVNEYALGVVFAVDSGASVLQPAIGALNNNTFAIAAIDYAYDSGVVNVGSAADENAFHLNFPGGNDHSLYVHAITHDGSKVSSSTTFLNFNNCTNYGPRLELSTSGNSCSSEATGKTSGVVGLLYAAAIKAELPFPGGAPGPSDIHGARRLTAEEVRQLLITTADEIHVPEAKSDPTKYPTRIGWEQRFGFGRTNARSAVDAVLAGRIPPEVDLQSPEWFDVLYPERAAKVRLEGRLAYRTDRYQSMDYVIEWAPGANPDESEFTTLTEKKGVSGAVEGLIYEWDISALTIDNPEMPAPDRVANRRMITVRIRVTAHSDSLGQVEGVTRKAFHVERDPDLLSGFPVRLIASGEGSPKTADLDGDGAREIIIATSDGLVHVIGSDGKPKPGWPARLNRLAALDPDRAGNVRGSHAYKSGAISPDQHSANAIASPVSVGDLDGDGSLEVVAPSADGFVFAYDKAGAVRPGFPVALPEVDLTTMTDRHAVIERGVATAVVLADLDGDDKLELVVAGMDGQIHVYRHDGAPQPGFPVLLQDPAGVPSGGQTVLKRARITSSPAVGDIDGDGTPDIVVGTNEPLDNFGPLYVVHGSGSEHPSGQAYHAGWPKRIPSIEILPFVGEGLVGAPALADLNGDGLPEIAIAGVGTAVQILRNTGEARVPACFDVEDVDLDQPGWQDHVVPCARKIVKSCAEEEAADRKFRCLKGAMDNSNYGDKSDATDRPAVALVGNGSFGDLDNDGVLDVFWPLAGFGVIKSIATGGQRADYEHQVGGWRTLGAEALPGWPRRTDEWQFFHNPAIADLDGDNKPEVIAASAGYWVHAWNAEGQEPAGWPKLSGQWNATAPAIGDLTGDGKLEVVMVTRSGMLYAWRTKGSVEGRIDWESSGHDNANTRNMATKLEQGISAAELPDAGAADGGATTDGGAASDGAVGDGGVSGDGATGGDDGGCSCETAGDPGAGLGWLLLLGAAALLLRRRRRCR